MKLYRFEKFDAKRVDSLRRGSVWMSTPDQFNDPFDCKLKTYTESMMAVFTTDSYREAVKGLYKNASDYLNDWPSLTWVYNKKILDRIFKWMEAEQFDSFLYKDAVNEILDHIRNFRMTCFIDGSPNDTIMWSHYAANHSGFCVEYEVDEKLIDTDSDGTFYISPVVYSSRLPEFDTMEMLLTPSEFAMRYLLSKGINWAYEREYRLINFTEGSSQEVSLPAGIHPTAVYAGLRANKNTHELECIASELGLDFYRIERHQYLSELKAVKAPPNTR
ncbi:DUF2971 domain-containing protein [Thalassolituus sp. ST750PaO-4]|uniref:DUF2971 domain-containing protein n=1 Tax=Thalassolituus sp. ST750PaO-4 TaxID=2742965 RepID=UPI001CE2D6C1|nr:DUF2971 domain-containing protein [Thalassolituus sp. ST750PaO-4]MCA6060686.1 DUF2971 domain-containing protein [Thalassolituus sp. ST750PaO-4]